MSSLPIKKQNSAPSRELCFFQRRELAELLHHLRHAFQTAAVFAFSAGSSELGKVLLVHFAHIATF
jgi:hypothetical protein